MPKINIDGEIREMTPEEICDTQRKLSLFCVRDITPEERMDQLEAALVELASLIAKGGSYD